MKNKEQGFITKRIADMVKEGEKLQAENPKLFAAMLNLSEEQSSTQKLRQERVQRLNNEYLKRRSRGIYLTLKSSFSHVISELRPCAEWEVGIDESGSNFSISGRKDSGKIVAFMAPSKVNLPSTGKSFHASEVDNLQEYNDRMQAIINTENTGVLGITADVLASFSGDRWRKSIIYLIEWVLRLLPVDGSTKVNFMVEKRFEKAFDWLSTADKIILDLKSWDKKKSELLQIKISEHPKNSHPVMDWADFLAYSWGCTQPHAVERLKRSGLRSGCFFNSSSKESEELEELLLYSGLLSKKTFPTEIWLRLFEIGKGRSLNSIEANKVLTRVKTLVAEDEFLWRKCLSAVTKLMDIRPVDLGLLHKTLEWLGSCAPENWSANRAVKMGFMSSELARKNHIGEVASSDFLDQLLDLTNELYNENAPFCCHVALRMAVSATNDYNYDKALGFLESWRRVPVETVGLVMWARLQSQFGQIAAFCEEWQKADSFFDSALSAFRQHSDQEMIAKDIEQT